MPEFRLYYDEQGKVVCYTCEDLPGNYIVIDRQTYAECRIDIRIVDDKIVKSIEGAVITKLIPSVIGIKCASIDVNIIVEDYDDAIVWNIKNYEYRYS